VNQADVEENKRLLVSFVDQMPAFPTSVQKVIELSANINCAPKDLAEVIEHDPVLTLNVLKLVNSAYFGLANAISSVNHAVVYVGFNTVKNLAITVATVGVLPKKTPSGFDVNGLLRHSLHTAATTRQIAANLGVANRDQADFFVAGLLHDIGKVVFAQFMPDYFGAAVAMSVKEQRPLWQCETKCIGVSHAEVGAMLAEKWRLSSELVKCIAEHHQQSGGPRDRLSSAVIIANQLAKQFPQAPPGSIIEEPPAGVRAHFSGLGLDDIATRLGDLRPEIEKVEYFARL